MNGSGGKRPSRTVWTNPVHFLAYGFGSGLLPAVPGTWGTLVAVPLYIILSGFGWPVYAGVLATFFLLGIWLCGRTAVDLGVHDHPGIVWDEITGYLATMFMAPPGWYWVVMGFVLFRLFDIWKPFPIRRLDRGTAGGFGIMIDDVAAAVYAAAVLQVMALLPWQGW